MDSTGSQPQVPARSGQEQVTIEGPTVRSEEPTTNGIPQMIQEGVFSGEGPGQITMQPQNDGDWRRGRID